MSQSELDLSNEQPRGGGGAPIQADAPQPFDPDQQREETRGDLARGLLWLLTFTIGGVLAFIGLGRLDGTVLTQSVFPSLIALAGTALGFYFGSQTPRNGDTTPTTNGGSSPSVVVNVPPSAPSPTPPAAVGSGGTAQATTNTSSGTNQDTSQTGGTVDSSTGGQSGATGGQSGDAGGDIDETKQSGATGGSAKQDPATSKDPGEGSGVRDEGQQ